MTNSVTDFTKFAKLVGIAIDERFRERALSPSPFTAPRRQTVRILNKLSCGGAGLDKALTRRESLRLTLT